MADEDSEEENYERNIRGSRYRHGVVIDSSRIKQANDDETRTELGFLGISVFNQDDFEEGIMKQLDEESARQNAEQQKKFAEKDLRIIRKDIGEICLELSNIEKMISGLLSASVPSSSLKVQEMQSMKEVKENQLKSLIIRERSLVAKLASLEEGSLVDRPLSKEVSFAPSVEGVSSEMIQSGLMTPFGGTPGNDLSSTAPVGKTSGESNLSSSPVQTTTEIGLKSSMDNIVKDETPPSSSMDKIVKDEILLPSTDEMMEDNLPLSSATHTATGVQDGFYLDSSKSSDEDEYVPGDMEIGRLGQSSSSEYMSSEEDCLEEILEPFGRDMNEVAEVGAKRGRRRKRLPKHLDDGNLELFRTRIRKWRAVEAMKELEGTATKEPDKELAGGLKVPGSIWSQLYPYQQTGVQWLWELHQQEIGGIVGDEMGLGKTIQMIAFLTALRYSQLHSNITKKMGLGPVLIACPATVMHQWVKEFHTWWPQFRVSVLHDTGTFTGTKKRLISDVVACSGVLLTTYEGIRIYRAPLLKHQWEYVILDEGHKIRNPDAEVTLVCKQFRTPHRVILSGSPMQNNLKELWSLFDFVFPGKLGTLPVFMEEFSVPITQGGYANASQVQVETAYRCACVLRDSIMPYLLRRVKSDVKLQLPKKSEQVLFCRLTSYQRELYEDFLKSPEVESMMTQRLRAFSGLTTLRKLCNHPDLIVPGSAQEPTGEGKEVVPTRWNSTLRPGGPLDEDKYGYWEKSGKMIVVEALLRLWSKQQHRVLLFSQTKQMLDLLEQFVVGEKYIYRRMDGTTPISSRQPLISEFNDNESIFVFLLTTRVGGLGVNLTGADRVIIYDPDWNPSTDTQARERAWRIGQTRPVTIYRLLTAGTIEEKIYHRQIFKQYLTNRVLKDPRQRRLFKSNDLMDLFSLGSDNVTSTTETSAIFAGTGADIKRPGGNPGVKDGKITKGSGRGSVPRKAHSTSTEVSNCETISTRQKKSFVSTQAPFESNETNLKSHPKRSKTGLEFQTDSSSESQPKRSKTVGESRWYSERGDDEDSDKQESSGQRWTVSPLGVKDHGGTSTARNGGKSLQDIRKAWQSLLAGNYESSTSDNVGGSTSGGRMAKDKKGKKKLKSVVVDGSVIGGVERKAVYMKEDSTEDQEGEEEANRSEQGILAVLFSKGGVHSAMHHDKVIHSDNPDYVLVESEAKRVAERAAKALKESREQCSASWGTPTWTGQHGSAGLTDGIKKPRFGTVSALGLSTTTGSGTDSSSSGFGLFGQQTDVFGGKREDGGSHSSDLLAKMRARNVARSDIENNDFVTGNTSTPASGDTSKEHKEFLRDLRDFVALRGSIDGQATTDEILHKFSKRVPLGGAAMFKSLLSEICTFYRQNGRGIWRLKDEYR